MVWHSGICGTSYDPHSQRRAVESMYVPNLDWVFHRWWLLGLVPLRKVCHFYRNRPEWSRNNYLGLVNSAYRWNELCLHTNKCFAEGRWCLAIGKNITGWHLHLAPGGSWVCWIVAREWYFSLHNGHPAFSSHDVLDSSFSAHFWPLLLVS